MTRHSANQAPFDSRFRPASHRFDAGDNSVRVALVAIHHGLQPAAFLGSHPLQRLQVLLSAPGEGIESDLLNPISRMPAGAPPQLLPQMPATNGGFAPRPRLVQGEILTDDDGRLYEKVGHRIRPLQRLFSGRRGEVLELPAGAPAEHLVTEQTPQAPDAEASKPKAQAETRADAPAERRQSPERPYQRHYQRQREASGAPFSGGRSFTGEPLPPEGVAQNAMRQPPTREAGAPNARRQPPPPEGVTPNGRRQAPPPEGGAPNARYEPFPYEGGAPNGRRQSFQSEAGVPNGRCLKTVQEQWIKPWEFQISREEAFYDMRIAASSSNALLGFLRGLTNWFGNRQSWRKWRALLSGKSLDEQLWAVRPPRGMIASPAVRDWARLTLEQAGYDPGVMLVEWEIFWRRKGL